ncbi:Alpha-(1,3)-fucosyltransferase 4 [Holothuria leucospilota]|uniref:Fucosyltransferase n=1 Tax=Holothuria leucospilota TaxID=206669 RepID=A0A9Q1CF30_HOLLE|nr:Alpha-(1,3)-fucosyltransferase 4 [Holothuria leucospilota]
MTSNFRTYLFLFFQVSFTIVLICLYYAYNTEYSSHSFAYPAISSIVPERQFDPDEGISYYEEIIQEHNEFYVDTPEKAVTDINIRPAYRGSDHLCLSRTRSVSCLKRDKTQCLKVSFVGLCGRWSSTLRQFPFEVTCKGTPQRKILVDHVDKPKAIENAQIVIFSFVASYLNMDVWLALRRFRPRGQMWVFQTEESPYYAVGLLPPWNFRNDSYNTSITFHSAADIQSPYGYYEPFRNEESNILENFTEILAAKKNFMIWISSHCETLHWDRTRFVKDLQRSMRVDIFGRCGNDSLCKTRWQDNCVQEVDDFVKSYKFILSLENSCCEDYVTEKLWHSFTVGTVPVVIGPRIENYERLAPPGSFIHVDQFSSVESLRDYLKHLDKNDTAYLEYFKWKKLGKVREHTIKEHYQNHVSDENICTVVDQYFERQNSAEKLKMFDPYGPRWKGLCHQCGRNSWIQNYQFPLDHERKNPWIWA